MELFGVIANNQLPLQLKLSEEKKGGEGTGIFSLLLSFLIEQSSADLPLTSCQDQSGSRLTGFPCETTLNLDWQLVKIRREDLEVLEKSELDIPGEKNHTAEKLVQTLHTAEIDNLSSNQKRYESMADTGEMVKPFFPGQVLLNVKPEGELENMEGKGEKDFDLVSMKKTDTILPKVETIEEKGKETTGSTGQDSGHLFSPSINFTEIEKQVKPGKLSYCPVNREPGLVSELTEELVSRLQIARSEGETQIEIQLKPGVLGKLKVELHHQEGKLSARFITGNIQVKDLLSAELPLLRDTLSQQSILQESTTVDIFLDYQDPGDTGRQTDDFRQRQQVLPGEREENISSELSIRELNLDGVINYLI